ncbi:hypothetical protein [Streptomyces caniscabiei]|uniref:hypothetical protein n=1 Tax=Streptomyces caniscabiei TaxID=2746961 RepID=UPI000765BA25|nr:hypothetical protein [Streptomyces caniscabiei]
MPRSGTATSREGQNPRASARGASQNKNSFKARLTVTNQKTWHNDKYPKVERDDYVEVTKKTKKNGHACAALYVGPSSHYPAWMACIN